MFANGMLIAKQMGKSEIFERRLVSVEVLRERCEEMEKKTSLMKIH